MAHIEIFARTHGQPAHRSEDLNNVSGLYT